MKFSAPKSARLPDVATEAVRRELVEKVVELQTEVAATSITVVANVTLKDGVATPVAHPLGRAAAWVRESCVRGAVTVGMVQRVDNGKYDASRFVVLMATGYGATITCSLAVV